MRSSAESGQPGFVLKHKVCGHGRHRPGNAGPWLRWNFLHSRCAQCGLHIVQVGGEWFVD